MRPDAPLNEAPPLLTERLEFPDPRGARSELFPGLVALGGDLSVERLLLAYRSGIFPWTPDPITWWSPDPRAVLEFDGFHVPRSLRRVLRRCRWRGAPTPGATGEPEFEITLDRAFGPVIRACARQRGPATWISPVFITAYVELHRRGHAHSLECWRGDELVGGIYGVSTGGFFAGESMFHHVSNASKAALYFLMNHLRARGFRLFDLQMLTPVTRQFGATEIPREEYLRRLSEAIALPVRFGPSDG